MSDDSTNVTGSIFAGGRHSSYLFQSWVDPTVPIWRRQSSAHPMHVLDLRHMSSFRSHSASKVSGVKNCDLTISNFGCHQPSLIWREVSYFNHSAATGTRPMMHQLTKFQQNRKMHRCRKCYSKACFFSRDDTSHL